MEIFYVLGALVLTAVTVMIIYNGIIGRFNSVKRAWSNVIVHARQKNKILPHLEVVISQYEDFEKGVLVKITQLRAALNELDDSNVNNQTLRSAEHKAQALVSSLKLTSEDYPELKASPLFKAIMAEISEQQENVGAAIRIYNQNVEIFNTGIQTFPNSIINNLLNKKEEIALFTDSEAQSEFEFSPNID
ncbi:LemA family protein [Psychromonas sp. SP041]|uniref:LemA family protein n=1 Tax=Psychromonas sp. SP041 TaxID=1365007 RepID=UPI00040E8551|nr:LemA family protein [Psychromonas sp. SP041]